MLIINSKFPKPSYIYGGSGVNKGTGVFDIVKNLFQKTANSSIGKKVISSATKENLEKVVNSAIGQEIKNKLLSGVAEASKDIVINSAKKIGLPVSGKKRKRKRKESSGKRRKGNGIIWE